MEKSATLHYIKLAFIPRDYEVTPDKNSPLAPQTRNPRAATGNNDSNNLFIYRVQ